MCCSFKLSSLSRVFRAVWAVFKTHKSVWTSFWKFIVFFRGWKFHITCFKANSIYWRASKSWEESLAFYFFNPKPIVSGSVKSCLFTQSAVNHAVYYQRRCGETWQPLNQWLFGLFGWVIHKWMITLHFIFFSKTSSGKQDLVYLMDC